MSDNPKNYQISALQCCVDQELSLAIAAWDGGLVGTCTILNLHEERPLLVDLYVDPVRRGQGIARAILQRALRWANKNDKRLCLYVQKTNLPALALYEDMGWQKIEWDGDKVWFLSPSGNPEAA